MKRLRPLVAGAAASLAVGLAACGNGPPQSSGSSGGGGACPGSAGASLGSPAVKLSATDSLQFQPSSSSAKVGQVVGWTNTGSVLHNITFDQSCLTDGNFAPQGTWQIKFSQPGTYSYKCTIHPGMDGSLT
ncbi:MAG: plastocyanin/azurin family copper-binding protein, partial [Candidatus Dormibacteria bacterium]